MILVFYYKLYPYKIKQRKHVDLSPQCIEINRSSLFSQVVIISPITHRGVDLHKQQTKHVPPPLFAYEILHQSAVRASRHHSVSVQVLICPNSQSTGSLPLQSFSLPILREKSSELFRL